MTSGPDGILTFRLRDCFACSLSATFKGFTQTRRK